VDPSPGFRISNLHSPISSLQSFANGTKRWYHVLSLGRESRVVRRFVLIVLTLLLVLAAGLMTAFFIFRQPTPLQFQQATPGQPVSFPRDEAAHFDVQGEWWYYTGFLTGQDQQSNGFELVFFKVYMPSDVRIANVVPLEWVSNPLYFAHFAISDEAGQKHVFFERSNFPIFWGADASSDQYQVHNGDWRAWGSLSEHHLRAAGGRYRLRLDLESNKPPALHGPGASGVIDIGQAGTSYYYSEPDLQGVGLFYEDGVPQVVEATAWMDHQWGSWRIHGGYKGWDWFSLRLDDDNQIMLFNFRNEDGSVQSEESSGTWIYADGTTQHLTYADYTIEVLDQWTSLDTSAAYPVKWHLTVPGQGVDVTVTATFPEQEMAAKLGPVYWEGTVTVEGTAPGVGFVELTGYVP
jgi:predicted secreted hydrolase